MTSYTDEIFENQRRGLKGWSAQLLITDREAWSDRAGDPIKRDPVDDGALSMQLPRGWKWTSEWMIDTTYTQCDTDGSVILHFLNNLLISTRLELCKIVLWAG